MIDADGVAKQEIAEVVVRYATGIDRREWAVFRSCFTDDCHADYGEFGTFDGVDALTEFMIESHAAMGHTMHRVTNIAITVTGETAVSRSYVDAVLMADDGLTGVNPIAIYDDDLVSTADGWRISRRVVTMVAFKTIG